MFWLFSQGTSEKKSDLDILVEIDDPITLLEFVRMENYLSELTGMKIDLVMKDALKPRIGKHILHEVVTL